MNITSGVDGIHADTALTINGGELAITQSYEGLESVTITLNDGTIDLVASAVAKARLLQPQEEMQVPVTRRALVIGGGDCGALREILKHESIERAVQCEIDRLVTMDPHYRHPHFAELAPVENPLGLCRHEGKPLA